MEYLEGYAARMNANSSNTRDRKVEDARARAIRHFEDDPSFFSVNALEPMGVLPITKRIRVINESVLRQINPERVYSKYIIPHPEEFMYSGTMLFGLYDVDWLVTAVTGLGDITQQAMLQKMNEAIVVKMPTGDNVIPAVLNEVSRLGDGVLETNLAMRPDRLVKVRVQENEITRAIKVNARFKAINNMFTIMKIDLSTDDGVINWIAREDLLEHGDDVPTPTPDEEVIQGPDKITRARNFDYVAPPGVVSWSLEDVSPNGEQIVQIISSDENTVVIRASKTQLITFKLIAHYGSATKEKSIRLVSLL